MKNLLFIFVLSFLMFNCSSDGLEDASKTEEPFTYSNGNLSTGKVSSTGLVAPQGYELSEFRNSSTPGMGSFYLNFQENARYYVSDDFVVPQNESWKVENMIFSVINPDPVSPNFPVKNVVVEIYDGNPELATSKKLYGDMETNLFRKATPTKIYRITPETVDISNGTQASLIYDVESSISNLELKSGHYWYKMTMRFDYGEDWSCWVPRLPQAGNNEASFNAYWKDIKSNTIYNLDGNHSGLVPINYETPFKITGIKTEN